MPHGSVYYVCREFYCKNRQVLVSLSNNNNKALGIIAE